MSMSHKALTHQLGMAGLAVRRTCIRLRLFNEIFLGGAGVNLIFSLFQHRVENSVRAALTTMCLGLM